LEEEGEGGQAGEKGSQRELEGGCFLGKKKNSPVRKSKLELRREQCPDPGSTGAEETIFHLGKKGKKEKQTGGIGLEADIERNSGKSSGIA